MSDVVYIVQDVNEDGWGFETPDGDAYGGPDLEAVVDQARSLGFNWRIELEND